MIYALHEHRNKSLAILFDIFLENFSLFLLLLAFDVKKNRYLIPH